MSSSQIENVPIAAEIQTSQKNHGSKSSSHDLSDGDAIRSMDEEAFKKEALDLPAIGLLDHGESVKVQRNRQNLGGTFGDDVSKNLPPRSGSPVESDMSIPDDTPSIQGSMLSSPGSSILPSLASRPGLGSPTPSFRPFDRRFSSRYTFSPLNTPRASSPAFLASHSRHASLSSRVILDIDETETTSPRWEVVRWTRLNSLDSQVFSEGGRRKFGTPTCIAISTIIVLGTSKGVILVFDYHQALKSIIGLGTKAVECGPVISVAISADYSTVAGGHANGNIFTWEVSRAARPFLHIPPMLVSQLETRTVDGHVENHAVTHVGFLGARHTAVVSANDRGMAFSHLASRGSGVIGRSIKTTRVLGRYQNDAGTAGKARKASTVLAFAPLPLGNIERAVDGLGLTALLTPYLLVIVSTTPIAQTQHKSARPKEIAAHSTMSGCLAWFPAVKLKVPDPQTGDVISKVKLVYCWSNVLTVLDVEEVEATEKDKPPSLFFRPRNRWRAGEAIVAVQWLSRSVLTVLTITQRMIVLEDQSMRMTEAFDLVQKHIFHRDLFSTHLHGLVEQLDEEDASMHGVVADAFYMSFKAYKGRMFLLCFSDMSIGTLSNWADRLVALVENGDYTGAILLANSYFTGAADKLTIGLPEDTNLRHSMVRDKVVEIISASLKYAFGKQRAADSAIDNHDMKKLAEACFTACLSIFDMDFLFEDIFEWFAFGDMEGIFLETMEPYVLEQQIRMIPPGVVKALVSYYVSSGMESRLEDMICRMEPATLDLDEITTLCKQHNLYDALIYVWNRALGDYVTPLVELLSLLIPLQQQDDYFLNGNLMENPIFGVNALKMFPYLSYTLSGRRYPTGETLDDAESSKAKAEVYWFLFSSKTVTWPRGTDKEFRTKPFDMQEPSFPYLRMILKYDAPSLFSTLNEAFEDVFLTESPNEFGIPGNDQGSSDDQYIGSTINRQYILRILLEVMDPQDFAQEDTIYLDMFIARNLPKYPQSLVLNGSRLHEVLKSLCNYPGEDIAEDAQLSAEYLLSVYRPSDLSSILPLLHEAGFFRVLKTIYKTERRFADLIQTYFDDPHDQEEIFDCVAESFHNRIAHTTKQKSDIEEVLRQHVHQLIELNPVRTARLLNLYAPTIHEFFIDAIANQPQIQFLYLQAILEPSVEADGNQETPEILKDYIDHYVQLMCQFNPSHVANYVTLVPAGNLHLKAILPAMEENGAIDAAIVLVAREGHLQEAMDRLARHMNTLEAALLGLITIDSGLEETNMKDDVRSLTESIQKYSDIGIWLCHRYTGSSPKRTGKNMSMQASGSPSTLSAHESLWLDLIESAVQITKAVSGAISKIHGTFGHPQEPFTRPSSVLVETMTVMRNVVQKCFTALLDSTSTSSAHGTNTAFLRILRAFLVRMSVSSPSLSDLRAVLASIFAAYAYEENLLHLTNRLIDKDVFTTVKDASGLRQRGWRAQGSVCAGCNQKVWGPGAAGDIFNSWDMKRIHHEQQQRDKRAAPKQLSGTRGKEKAQMDPSREKASATEGSNSSLEPGLDHEEHEDGARSPSDKSGKIEPEDLGPLMIFACRHIYHRVCLERAASFNEELTDHDGHSKAIRCPIHTSTDAL